MKTHSLGSVLMLVTLLLAGCTTTAPDPNLTRTRGRIGGAYGAFVNFEARKLDDHTYEIIACGQADLTEAQYLEGWIWMANKLAAGRPYEKQTKTGPWEYDGGGVLVGMPTTRSVGTKVTGRMVLQ